jgi:galacturonosyltransferase
MDSKPMNLKILGNFYNNLKSMGEAFAKLFFFAFKSKPQFCFVYNIKPMILWGIINRFFNVPSVCTITGTITYRKGDEINQYYKSIIAFALKSYKYVVFQNEFDKLLFESVLKSNQIALVVPGSGVDINYYIPKEDQKTEINFLFIGRLVKEKGILEYLEASKRLKVQYPELKFGLLGPMYTNSISGSSINADLINLYVNEYGLQYYGESKEVDKFIAKTECLVLPSYGEGISNVLLEAGAMAKPLITTNVPGCREIVENGRNGLLCESQNIDSLKNAMENFMNLSKLQKEEMGTQSRRKIILEFSKSSVIEKYMKLLIKL